MTACGSKGTSPAPRKPPLILSSVILALYAALNAIRNSTFEMWLICALINALTSRPYARFNGPKHPTSSGWVI